MKIQILHIDIEFVKSSIRTKNEKRFYVYIHRKLSDNKPFYIGKGTRYRCMEWKNRSEYWKNTANKYGVYVQIYKNELSNEESCLLEKELIKKLGIKKLVNFTKGGEPGAEGEKNYFFNKKLFGELNGNWMNRGSKNPNSIKVYKLDFKGKILKEYDCIDDVKNDGFSPSAISAVCRRKRKQCKGFLFCYQKDYKTDLIYSPGKTSKKKVDCYDRENNLIKSYNSVNETAIDGFSPKIVSACLTGKKKSHLNRIFKYSLL